MGEVTFSIFMCARNSEETIQRAIDSVRMQGYPKWEMIIVDNGSTGDATWRLIQNAMEQDDRIRGIRLGQNVGWPKGASICMEYAVGRYMMFLSADDFFLGSGHLQAIEDVLTQDPDMVFTGFAYVELKGRSYQIRGGNIPERKLYTGEDVISNLADIMGSVYYNSFFHFIRMELLRDKGIDFFEPFYGDYEGVTEAICQSSKIAVVDSAVYALTLNTSQTRGASTWKGNVMQWRSVKNALVARGGIVKKNWLVSHTGS